MPGPLRSWIEHPHLFPLSAETPFYLDTEVAIPWLAEFYHVPSGLEILLFDGIPYYIDLAGPMPLADLPEVAAKYQAALQNVSQFWPGNEVPDGIWSLYLSDVGNWLLVAPSEVQPPDTENDDYVLDPDKMLCYLNSIGVDHLLVVMPDGSTAKVEQERIRSNWLDSVEYANEREPSGTAPDA